MKNLLIIMLSSLFVFGAYAQDSGKKDKKADKETTSKVNKEKPNDKVKDKSKDKDKDNDKVKDESKDTDKVKGKDDATVFIGEPEGEIYQLEQRRAISKPSMPLLDVEQGFNQKMKKKKQQDAFMNDEYFFPAKPKNAWQLGVRGGIAMLNGDVNQNFFKGYKPFVPGYTFGVTVTKPFSYLFSVRLNYDFMEFWNTDWQPSTMSEDLIRHTDYELASYINDNPNGSSDLIYHNSHTVAHDMTLDAVLTFGNIRYHKERAKVVFNVFLTAGGFMYQTWYDHLDDNGDPYDYRSIPVINSETTSKKDVIEALNNMRNGVYETQADGHPNSKNPTLFNNYSFRPVGGGGVGITFRLNRIMNLDVQTRMMFTKDDLVDGHRWQEPDGNSTVGIPGFAGGGTARTSRGLTRDFDTYANTTVGITFKLVSKKKTESLTMLNPMHYSYQKIAENDPERAIEELLKDDDGDGVPNRLDEEADTPEGAPVSPKGIALDSDADGVLDVNDDEPFSPPGVPVNEKGIAQLPPTPPPFDANATFNCDDVILPSVHFDKDKYNIKPEFYAHLYNLADKMTLCPDLKIKATGMTDKDDNEKYNEQLSWNRVNAVIDYLNEKYGIDKSRFIAKYDGEANAAATSSIEQYKERKVMLEQAAPGEAGESSPAPPHPGIKAGSNR